MSVHRHGPILIRFSADLMQALISINAKGADFPARSEIEKALDNSGIKVPILEETLAEICENRHAISDVEIARGENATAGDPAKLVWHVDVVEGQRPTIMADGKADFKRLRQFEWVEGGQELVAILPAVAGAPGRNILGDSVESQVADASAELPPFKNCVLSDDGLVLSAENEGYACIQNGTLVVDNVYHIQGDVDFSTGNVKFEGTVMIDGDIRSGFRVEATESIYVDGSIEAADVYSRNGSVVVRSGILGRNRAKILAGDSLHCGFIQDAVASVKNDVIIKHYAINSHITCGGEIQLLENEGLARGGKLTAERGVDALELGSDRSIPTEVVLSRSDVHEENSIVIELQEELQAHQQNLHNLEKRKQFLELLKQRVSSLSPEREAELANLDQAQEQIKTVIQDLRTQLNGMLQKSGDSTPNAVVVRNTLHRKVSVTIGHKQYYCTQPKSAVKIFRQGDDVVVTPLRETPGVSP